MPKHLVNAAARLFVVLAALWAAPVWAGCSMLLCGAGSNGGGAAPPVTVQWNASDKSAGITLSGSPLLTAKDTNGSGNDTVRADTSVASGSGKKWYFEIVANTVPGAPNPGSGFLGLANSSLSLTANPCGTATNAFCSRDDQAVIFINFGSCASQAAWGANGTNVGFAVRTDISPPKAWVRVGGGSWDNTTDDPATNVGGCDISGLTFPLFPYFSSTSFNYQVTAQFASASWSFSAPSGFTAWGN